MVSWSGKLTTASHDVRPLSGPPDRLATRRRTPVQHMETGCAGESLVPCASEHDRWGESQNQMHAARIEMRRLALPDLEALSRKNERQANTAKALEFARQMRPTPTATRTS